MQLPKQVERLQRSHVRSLQYNRRESVELSGIPESIGQENLEGTCVGILNEIGCVNVTERDIHTCHRLKNKKNVIIRFVNRKDADLALHNRGKLKDIDKEGKFKIKGEIYINESLCRPLQFLHWKCAFKGKKIDSYNLWKGVNYRLKSKTGTLTLVISMI